MEVNIHAHLAIKVLERPSMALWYLCRMVDYEYGSGKAIVTRKQIEEQCGNASRSTTWRWLNDKDLIRHYFYSHKLNAYVVYYRGLVEVCRRLGVYSLGGIGQSDTVQSLACQAVNIEAIKRQNMSAYMAKHSESGWTVVKPEVYFDTEGNPLSSLTLGSKTARACKFRDYTTVKGRTVMIVKSTCATYGASQKGIAEALGVSVSTVQDHSVNAPKLQVAQFVRQAYYNRALFECEENGGSPIETGFVVTQQGVIKLLPYRYYPLFTLVRQRHLRNKLSKPSSCPVQG